MLGILLAVLWLVAWDYHRFRSLFTEEPLLLEYRPVTLRLDPLERAGGGAGHAQHLARIAGPGRVAVFEDHLEGGALSHASLVRNALHQHADDGGTGCGVRANRSEVGLAARLRTAVPRGVARPG